MAFTSFPKAHGLKSWWRNVHQRFIQQPIRGCGRRFKVYIPHSQQLSWCTLYFWRPPKFTN